MNNKLNDVKKRKNSDKKVKNAIKTVQNSKNIANLPKQNIALFVWVKTLLCVHDVIPNIINLIDKMVLSRGSSVSQGSFIFGDYKHGTYNQIEELIDLGERKKSLLNLYAIIEHMVNSLPQKYKSFVELKFYKKKSVDYVACEFEIDQRTVFRWSNIVINKLVEFCKENNWSELFFLSQTESEYWIKEQYKNNLKKFNLNYSKSSSSM